MKEAAAGTLPAAASFWLKTQILSKPAFGLLGGFVDLGKGLDSVQHRLHCACVELLVEDCVEVEVFDLATARQDTSALAVRGDQSAAVDLDFSVLSDEAELDGEPEETAHALQLFLIGEAGADLAVALEKASEDRVRVHGDVAEDVVEDVGLRGVLHGIARAEPGGGGKHPISEHLEEGVGREKAADRG